MSVSNHIAAMPASVVKTVSRDTMTNLRGNKQMTPMEFTCGPFFMWSERFCSALTVPLYHTQSLTHSQREHVFIRSHKVNSPVECF